MQFPDYFQISMKISGCEKCDSPYIEGGPDMIIELNYTLYIVKCDQIWELHGICGTYLEVHKPLNKDIIYEQQIKGKGTLRTQMLTKQLQSGRYEIWVVVRSKIGSVIQYVKSFYITIVNQ
ncbi:unnamed protein product [Paramecium sonneborni]|uniref:Uncharacterized protein n=1 Tax=Paramecium sonneborni TaxID=65129 RepID=A0A8S1Q7V4_9CILI|nr:unnamed protein product [Paramecium sonneborni]